VFFSSHTGNLCWALKGIITNTNDHLGKADTQGDTFGLVGDGSVILLQ